VFIPVLTLTLSVVFLHPRRGPAPANTNGGTSHMTTVLSPIACDHLVQVVHHKACGHRAECWCGWAGAWCDDYATADAAAHHHRETAAGPATGLDATLGGLLALPGHT